jgi:hypothetical protein
MSIEGFNYQEFAQSLTEQAAQLVPQDFNEMQRNYVTNTLFNFSVIAGEALYNDTEMNFDLDQAIMITQIIAEWSFHKSVDLIRSELPQQFWDPIMQKIAFTIFEVAKQAFKQGLPQDQVLQLIEHHVKKTYVEAIQELKDKELIDDNLMDKAANQSNIDAMMQEASVQEQIQEGEFSGEMPMPEMPAAVGSPKVLKLATLAMLFKQMRQEKVQSILDKFSTEDAQSVIKFMGMDDLDKKMDAGATMKCLKEITTQFPKSGKADLSPSVLVAKIKEASTKVNRKKLEQMLSLERKNVQKFVFKAVEGEYFGMAPRVANLIAAHVADSVE